MKKRMIFLLMVIMALFAMACSCSLAGLPSITRTSVSASGVTIVEDREVTASITEVEIDGNGHLYFTQGEDVSLTLEGDSNYVANVQTYMDGNTLVIRPKQAVFFSWFSDPQEVDYYLTLPELEKLQVAGAIDVYLGEVTLGDLELSFSGGSGLISDSISADLLSLSGSGSTDVEVGKVDCLEFNIELSGSSDFDVERIEAEETVDIQASGSADMTIEHLYAETFDVDTSGSASLSVENGTVTTQNIKMSGSGDYSADGLKTSFTNLRGSGSTEFDVWVLEELYINTSGSAEVNYSGSPEISQDTSGSFSIESMDDY